MSTSSHNIQKKQLLGVLDHVYGPYDDFSFFDPKKFPPTGCIPALTDVELYLNKEQIGFDDSEYINTPPAGSILQGNQDVLLFGVIEVESLNWLLPQARRELERDLRAYDNQIRSINGRSPLTLKSIYGPRSGEGYTLKVRIACVKRMLASVVSKNYPGALIVFVATENRNFVVRTMHPETMLRSRAFLERSQLLLLLKKFIEEDEHKTPLHKRDLSWLMDCYYSMGLPQAVSTHLRYNQPVKEVPGISTEPRHVRHLAHAHIRGVFAEHAEWLLAVQIATASKNAQILDIPSWIAFCRNAQEDSLSARKSGYPWGIFHSGAKGVQHAKFEKLATILARFGDTKEEWERRLKNAVKRAHKQKKKQKSSSPNPDVDMEPSHPKHTFQFDSDFSEASTEYDSDNSSELDFRMMSQLPPFLFEPPSLPAGSFDWRCPSSGCNFAIDLLSVPASLLSKLPLQHQKFVISRCWNLKDARIQEIFNQLVSDHYEGHLSNLGFSLLQTGPDEWKLQQVSQRSPKAHKIKKEESNRSMALAR